MARHWHSYLCAVPRFIAVRPSFAIRRCSGGFTPACTLELYPLHGFVVAQLAAPGSARCKTVGVSFLLVMLIKPTMAVLGIVILRLSDEDS
jgi:hypothetical protein